jgi:hypothetical protein
MTDPKWSSDVTYDVVSGDRSFPLRFLAIVLVGGVVQVACSEPSTATDAGTSFCADEFYEGTVTFPDGTTHQACSPAAPDGIVMRWTPVAPCGAEISSAVGGSAGGDVTWFVGPGWERIDPLYRGNWVAPIGPVKLEVVYTPTAAPPSQCVPGEPLSCEVRAYGCEFELTQAAVVDGDMIEGHLTAPCNMRVVGDYTNPWQPTLTSFRFRTHLSGLALGDGGVDGGIACP